MPSIGSGCERLAPASFSRVGYQSAAFNNSYVFLAVMEKREGKGTKTH